MCYIQGMSSCAVQEIVSLSEHLSPEAAFTAFCRQTIGDATEDCKPNDGYNYQEQKDSGNKGSYTEGLGENYVFHGTEAGCRKLKHDGIYPRDNDGYASRFAAWITENNLGAVHGGDPVANHRYHSHHICRVFVFNPNRPEVFKWWNSHRPKQQAKPAPKKSMVLPEAPVVGPEVAKAVKAPVAPKEKK